MGTASRVCSLTVYERPGARLSSFIRPTHDRLPEWIRNPDKRKSRLCSGQVDHHCHRRDLGPLFHRRKHWIFSTLSIPPNLCFSIEIIQSCRRHLFHATIFNSGVWTGGSGPFQYRSRVPPTTSGNYTSRLEGIAMFLRGFSNTPRVPESGKCLIERGSPGPRCCGVTRSGNYRSQRPL